MIERLAEHPASLAVLVLVIVVVLGWKRLPDMARSLGRSTRILKSEVDAMRRESDTPADATPTTSEAAPTTDQRSHAATHE